MKSIRTLTLGLALVAALPAAGMAQDGGRRLFDNSWFWGVKGGAMTFWTTRISHQPAPFAGIDWLITRRRAALLVSGEQAFFERKSSIYDPNSATQQDEVNMKDMRRLAFTVLAFPTGVAGHDFTGIRPYAGIGFSWNFIQTATIPGVQAGTAQGDSAAARLKDVQSAGSPHLMIGAQTQYRRVSLFGQASVMWAQKRFLLNNNETYFLEGGMRINLGSAIERPN